MFHETFSSFALLVLLLLLMPPSGSLFVPCPFSAQGYIVKPPSILISHTLLDVFLRPQLLSTL